MRFIAKAYTLGGISQSVRKVCTGAYYAMAVHGRQQTASTPSYPGMERWRGRTALVTGASSGVGYELAGQLAQLGMDVVGCDRNVADIEVLAAELKSAPGKLVAVKCDVTKEEDILAVFEVAKAQLGGVDVCVNSAGLAHNAPLLSGATSEWRNMFEVNVLGVCVCTREFVKQLKERRVDDGHIFLLNSMSGHRIVQALSVPNVYFYAATKFAITALTEGIRQELRDKKSNIKVTGISPGDIHTKFIARLMKAEESEYDTLLVDNALEAEDIASAIIYTLSTPPRMQIHDILVRSTAQAY